MTTTYHTPIVNGASNDASTVNGPLGTLDAELVAQDAILDDHETRITTLESGAVVVDQGADYTWAGTHIFDVGSGAYFNGTFQANNMVINGDMTLGAGSDITLYSGNVSINAGNLVFADDDADQQITFQSEFNIRYYYATQKLAFRHSDNTQLITIDRANKRIGIFRTSPSADFEMGVGINIVGGTTVDGPFTASYDGVDRFTMAQTSVQTKFSLENDDLGNDNSGPQISVGRNTSAGAVGPAPGTIQVRSATNALNYIWPDDSGNWRTSTIFPPTGNTGSPSIDANTAGTVVGTQTSFADSKFIDDELPSVYDAVARVRQAAQALRKFTYKSGSFNGERFDGLVTDLAPQYGMDRDEEHPQGKSLNVIQLHGDFIAVTNYLLDIVEEMRERHTH